MHRAMLARDGCAVERAASAEHGLGPERNGLQHIAATTDAAVDEHIRARANGRHDLGQHFDWRHGTIEIASAVVGNDDSVETFLHGALGILRQMHALDHDGALPAITQAGNVIPRQIVAAHRGCHAREARGGASTAAARIVDRSWHARRAQIGPQHVQHPARMHGDIGRDLHVEGEG